MTGKKAAAARVWEVLDADGKVVWSGSVNDDGHLAVELPPRARKTRVVTTLRCGAVELRVPGRTIAPGETVLFAPPPDPVDLIM